MSWAEVYKINSDMAKPLNKKIDDMFKIVPLDVLIDSYTMTRQIFTGGYYRFSTDTITFGASGIVKLKLLLMFNSYVGNSDYDITIYKNGNSIYNTSGTLSGTSENPLGVANVILNKTFSFVSGDTMSIIVKNGESFSLKASGCTAEMYGMLLPQPDNKTIIV